MEIFDANGNYIKTKWAKGDIISDDKLNKIETGLEELNSNYLDIRNELNEQLHLITPEKFGGIGDGVTDDTDAIQQAIDYASENGLCVFIPKTENGYLIENDLTVNSHVQILSDGARIILNKCMYLKGYNIIENLVIDGDWNTIGIEVDGDNCVIRHNTIKNIKNVTAEHNGFSIAIDILDNVYFTEIHHNIFDGLECQDDTEEGKENYGIARFIRMHYSPFTVIHDNIFKGSKSIKDTDYVHVQFMNYKIVTDEHPFAPLGFTYKKADGCIIRDNTFIQNHCKSCVKVQGSGVLVEHNIFYTDDTLLENNYSAVIRTLGADGISVIDNIIYNSSNNLGASIVFNYCRDVKFNNNSIRDTRTTVNSTSCQLFQYSIIKNCDCSYNDIQYNFIGNANVLYIDGTQDMWISDNTISVQGIDVGSTTTIKSYLMYLKVGSASEALNNIVFKNNIVNTSAHSKYYKSCIKGFNQVDGLNVANNIMNAETAFEFSGITNSNIFNNVIKVTSTMPILLTSGAGVVKNFNIVNNVFDLNNAASDVIIVRSYASITSMQYALNDIVNYSSSYQPVYDTGASAGATYSYIPGGYKAANHDYGYDSKQPTCSLQIGHQFFNRTTNKLQIWTGNAWV